MNLNNNVTTDRADRPLLRIDIEQRIQHVGDSNKLDVSGQNLQGIDLSGANLSRVNLSGVNLSRAHLSGADLSGASLIGTLITADSKEDLLHAIGVQWST